MRRLGAAAVLLLQGVALWLRRVSERIAWRTGNGRLCGRVRQAWGCPHADSLSLAMVATAYEDWEALRAVWARRYARDWAEDVRRAREWKGRQRA